MTPILPRFHRRQQQREAEANIERAVRESVDTTPQTVARATLPGDNRRLRGIPVVGFGIGGTAPGTDPLGELVRRWAG